MREFRFEDLASLACELPEEVLRYRMSGNLTEADAAIDRWLAQPVAEELKTRLRVEKKFLEILPQQFPYTTAEVVKHMQERRLLFRRRIWSGWTRPVMPNGSGSRGKSTISTISSAIS